MVSNSRFLVFFVSVFLVHSGSATSYSKPQLPCQPPTHSSYPFCDTSLPIPARLHSLVSLLTVDEKIQRLSDNNSAIPRLGIPAYEWWSESLHGIATNGPGITFDGAVKSATGFPQVILTAAAFNRTLWRSIAAAAAVEARAMFNSGQAGLTFWAPNVNVFVDPRWGRGQETPGEDPMVVSDYAVEYVRGLQGQGLKGKNGRKYSLSGNRMPEEEEDDDRLMLSACCKHLTAYDLELWHNFSRYSFNAVVTRQDMEDTYEPPFKSCVEKGRASCLMCAYNAVNGIPACANKDLLEKARTDWGFEGYITSDCDAVATIFEYQQYAKSPEEAAGIALKAGTDINCGTYMLRNMKSALENKIVVESDIDRALLNLFSVQFRLGLFNGKAVNRKFESFGPKDVCSSEHRRLALEAARQGIVLLKNEQKFLPLDKTRVSSLAVIGPMANTSSLGGDYTGIPCALKSVLDGLGEYIHKTSYASGCLDVACNSTDGFAEAVSIAKRADYVIVVVGLDLSQETEDHDRYSLLLPGHQMALVNELAGVSNKPLVLVLTGGGPLDISFAKKDPRIASVLWIGYPGEEGGKALSEIVFGDYNPAGRLPLTWYPESFTKVPMNDMNMRADPSRGYPGRTYRFYTGEKVYEFGHGLSYSSFSLELLSAPTRISLSQSIKTKLRRSILNRGGNEPYVHVDEVSNCNSLAFSVRVSLRNNGGMDGSRVVMLFSRAPTSYAGGAPQKQLIGFDRVHVSGNGVTETSISIEPCQHLSIVNVEGSRILPLGDHILSLEEIEHVVSVVI
ncbi:PREDICTED: probable beta-D-xylosidase 6 [Ipomoea nil]|uniref:probable beta-D-xylosidase 6 n=1 Tax=Ipomoea nil TaxID=35883 RepID=UPI000901E22D|nr:PREDICTED: probable beta-D-xylosidase 6 [Ipomoea nil]